MIDSIIHVRGNVGFILFMSITKLFVAIMIHYLVYKNKLSYSDKIIKFLPKYKHHDITINDILQHKSGLYSEWDVNFDSNNEHRKYALGLDKVTEIGIFKYNNYAYDILCEIIEKISKKSVDKYIGELFFNKYNIKYFWYSKKHPFGGFGLGIPSKEVNKLPYLLDFLHEIKYKHALEYDNIDLDGIQYNGHSGSGGQFLYFNLSLNRFLFICNTGGEPFKDEYNMDNVTNAIKSF